MAAYVLYHLVTCIHYSPKPHRVSVNEDLQQVLPHRVLGVETDLDLRLHMIEVV